MINSQPKQGINWYDSHFGANEDVIVLSKSIYEREDTDELINLILTFKGQIKAKYFFIDFYHLQSGDFKISNEISI